MSSSLHRRGLDTNSVFMYLRRSYRWVLVFFALLTFFYYRSGTSSAPTSQLEITRSSYDWSNYEPHHPLSRPQVLPSAAPKPFPKIQKKGARPSKFDVAVQEKRRKAVKATMEKSWNSYREFAWMRDELTPLSGGGKDTFGAWAASLVDGLDTLWIMGLKKEFNEAVEAALTIDWAKGSGTSCNMFETTIRYLGGFLAAYDLSKEPALLDKAIELGDMLVAGFDTPTHMPPFWFDYEKAKTGRLIPDDHQPAASAATLSLEFTRLAQLTGKDKYYSAVAEVSEKLYENQNITSVPGMWPTFFDLRNGVYNSDNGYTMGALSDSMYEYVLKMNLLLAGGEPKYEEMYRVAADTIAKNMLVRPMTPENLDILFTGEIRAGNGIFLSPEAQHLACFAGGMFAMGGKLFEIPEHVDIGARLTKGCMWAYTEMPSGIAPELFRLVTCDSLEGCEWDEKKWKEAVEQDHGNIDRIPKGFQNARDPSYMLRPEALESVFILYRVTGDEMYRETAWRMFEAIQKATETKFGNAAIDDVTVTNPRQRDSQESFWYAETLKYLYLTFSPIDYISLDDYVFNTEAHPLIIPKG